MPGMTGAGSSKGSKSGNREQMTSDELFLEKLMHDHSQLRKLEKEPIPEVEFLEKKVMMLREMISDVEKEKDRLMDEIDKERATLLTLCAETIFKEK